MREDKTQCEGTPTAGVSGKKLQLFTNIITSINNPPAGQEGY